MNLDKYWQTYEPNGKTHILIINGVQIASVQEGDESPYVIYAYDSDFQDLFTKELGSDIVEFETAQEAITSVNIVFWKWLCDTHNEILFAK